MNNISPPGLDTIWLHHSGFRYRVLNIVSGKSSKNPDNIEGVWFVHYTALMGEHQGNQYIRPLTEFMDGRFIEDEENSQQYY